MKTNYHPGISGQYTPDGDLLPVAIRCYLETPPKLKKRNGLEPSERKQKRAKSRPLRMMTIDVETLTQETLDNPDLMPGFDPAEWNAPSMPLLFGCAHLSTRKYDSKEWTRESEWTFYPDNLPAETLVKLRRYFRRDNLRFGDWWEPKDSPGVKAYFVSLSEFLKAFYREAVSQRCIIQGYNAGFDLSRLACLVGPAAKDFYRGGFSFILWPDPTGKHRGNLYRPRLREKQLGPQSILLNFSTVRLDGEGKGFYTPPCEILELSQFCLSLLGEANTLDDAAKALGIPTRKTEISGHGIITQDYFQYNRQDVLLTTRVAIAAMERFDRHPISRGHFPPGGLSETQVYSGASISKGYLTHMGIKSRLDIQPNFSRKAMAVGMESFLGGRSECRIWRTPVPVAPLDFVSNYPTVAGLQDLWELLTAGKVLVVRCVKDIRKLVKNITLDDLYNPETWKRFNGFVRIIPRGEILPVRAEHKEGGGWKIGNNPYFSDTPQWFAIADLVAAKIRDPEIKPEILEAFRLMPEGFQPDLKPVEFGGTLTIDPKEDDFFIKIVEERARVKRGLEPYKGKPAVELEALSTFLKIMAVSGAYGIYAEINRKELAVNATEIMNLWTSANPGNYQPLSTHYPEKGGRFFWAPLASLITAGGRLLLTMLQVEAENRGASYALMDTDSVFVTYRKGGGKIEMAGADQSITLLNDEQLDEIINKFDSLNLYDPDVIPHLLKHEYKEHQPLLALSLGPKRYVLLDTSGEPVAWKESALGAILPPTDDPEWIKSWWRAIASGDPLPFADGALIRKHSVRTWETYTHFKTLNTESTGTNGNDRSYQSQIKPFNFLIKAQPDLIIGSDEGPLIAPFERNHKVWDTLPWINTHSGKRTFITLDPATAAEASNESTCIKTIGSYFNFFTGFTPIEFRLPPNNRPGLLGLRPVQMESLTLIGKESHTLGSFSEITLIDPQPSEVLIINDEINIPARSSRSVPLSRFGKRAPADWLERISPILKDLPHSLSLELCEQHQVTPRTVSYWADLGRKPADRFRRSIEHFCVRFAERILKDSNVLVPTHKPNLIAVYTALAPMIREDARNRLSIFCNNFGPVATAREFKINRRTVRSWIDHPERIPIEKAVTLRNRVGQ